MPRVLCLHELLQERVDYDDAWDTHIAEKNHITKEDSNIGDLVAPRTRSSLPPCPGHIHLAIPRDIMHDTDRSTFL